MKTNDNCKTVMKYTSSGTATMEGRGRDDPNHKTFCFLRFSIYKDSCPSFKPLSNMFKALLVLFSNLLELEKYAKASGDESVHKKIKKRNSSDSKQEI